MTPAEPSPASADSPSRRRLLYAGVGLAALVAGGGTAWWKFRPHDIGGGGGVAGDLWRLSFDTPAGAPLTMAAFKGKPLLINFWATWCPPCVEELPLLDRFYRENSSKGWQVVGLAVDQLGPVRTFLQKMPLGFPVGLAGLSGTDLGKSLGNLTGALPFTAVFDAQGSLANRKMGKVSPDDLGQWLGRHTA